MQLAATRDAEFIGIFKLFDAQGDIRNQLFVQTILDVPRCHKFPFAARKWGVVDLEGHRDRRLIHRERRQ